jgi:hypothetical protein
MPDCRGRVRATRWCATTTIAFVRAVFVETMSALRRSANVSWPCEMSAGRPSVNSVAAVATQLADSRAASLLAC